MKINPLFTLMALLLSCIIAYTLYVFCQNDLKIIYTTLGGVVCSTYFLTLLGLDFGTTRKNINIKTLSSFFLLLYSFILVYFSFQNRFLPSFIISSSLFFILFLGLSFFISKQNN